MASGKISTKWTLGDLADFEALLSQGKAEQGGRRIYRESIAPHLERDLSEGQRRSQGLRLWLEAKRDSEGAVGRKLESSLGLAGLLGRVVGAVLGLGIVRGLLHSSPVGDGERAYNIWIFLGTTIGIQWVILLSGLIGWFFLRKSNRLSWSQELVGYFGRKLSGSRVSGVWHQLLATRSDGYGSVLGWRLAAISQFCAIWLNLGMVIGFLFCLFFLEVNFYWESTLADLSQQQLLKVTDWLSLPWSWLGEYWRPGESGVQLTSVEALRSSSGDGFTNQIWMRFFALTILVWGMFPRVVLYVISVVRERGALKKLDFQESRHRSLWREMAKVERKVVKTSQADGVVLLDVGGAGVQLESVRPFMLQNMRVNPEVIYQTGVLDASKEEEALAAMKTAELGVVMVVEGWSLSGPQMKRNYEKVRSTIGEKKPIRFLVVGTVKGELLSEVNEEEINEWIKFVDSLRDPSAEVIKWEAAS